jgi:hypothetical protein
MQPRGILRRFCSRKRLSPTSKIDAQNIAREGESLTDPSDTVGGRSLSVAEVRACGATSILKLDLQHRAAAVTRRLGVRTLEELARVPLVDLLRQGNCGLETICDLRLRVLRAIDCCTYLIPWKDSIRGQPLARIEMKALRQTPVSQMRLTSAAVEVVKKLQVRSALDVAVASREEVLGLRMRRSSEVVRQLDLAVWRIVAHTDRQVKSELRARLNGLRLRILRATAPDEGQDDSAASNDGETTEAEAPHDGSVYGRSLTTEEERICGATAVGVLGLSVRANNVAKALGLSTALDVARASREELADLKNCGSTTIREFRAAVVSAIEGYGTPASIDVGDADELALRVDAIISMLDRRAQFVLQKRFGMWNGGRTTLQGVAAILGCTRARVQQIEAKAFRRLRGSRSSEAALGILRQLRDFYLDPIRSPQFGGVLTPGDIENLIELGSSGKAPDSTRAIALRFLVGAFDEGLEHFKQGVATDLEGRFRSEDAATRFKALETEVRTLLTARGRPIPIDDLAKRLCVDGLETNAGELKRLSQVSSEIGISVGEVALRHWNKFGRGRAAARIERALAELGEPTHFSYVAEKMNFLFPDKAPFSGHAITATMLRYPDVFTSLGRGIYALRNWGVSRPPYVKDFVIDSMRRAGGQATIEHVADLGAKKHGFKQSSIAMTMSLNPTFFRHIQGSLYRLL